MFDISHDSPVPIHEQIISQIRERIATGALKPGARLPEYRALAQQMLTNPQAVARAYGDLEWDGALAKAPAGEVAVTTGAAVICRVRLQDAARQRLRQAVAQALAVGLPHAEITAAVTQGIAAAAAQPLPPDALRTAIKKPAHDSTHRDSQGIQDLSREKSPGSP